MNIPVVKRLILKDWYLNRGMIAVSLVAGLATIAVVAAWHGTQMALIFGMIVLVMIMIGMGAMVMVTIADERKLQTLPFVMTLPISYKEYTASKIVGSLLIFLVLWSALVAAMVLSILFLPGFPHGLIPFVVIMSVEILMSTCLITAVAVTTESHGWTVGVSQVGALSLNLIGWSVIRFPEIGRTMSSPAVHWSTTATFFILLEMGSSRSCLPLRSWFSGTRGTSSKALGTSSSIPALLARLCSVAFCPHDCPAPLPMASFI